MRNSSVKLYDMSVFARMVTSRTGSALGKPSSEKLSMATPGPLVVPSRTSPGLVSLFQGGIQNEEIATRGAHCSTRNQYSRGTHLSRSSLRRTSCWNQRQL